MQERRLEAERPLRRLVLEVFRSQKSIRPLSIFSGATCGPRLPGQCLGLADPCLRATLWEFACLLLSSSHPLSHVFILPLGPVPLGYSFQTSSSLSMPEATG